MSIDLLNGIASMKTVGTLGTLVILVTLGTFYKTHIQGEFQCEFFNSRQLDVF
jgi:hypothetical protein